MTFDVVKFCLTHLLDYVLLDRKYGVGEQRIVEQLLSPLGSAQ